MNTPTAALTTKTCVLFNNAAEPGQEITHIEIGPTTTADDALMGAGFPRTAVLSNPATGAHLGGGEVLWNHIEQGGKFLVTPDAVVGELSNPLLYIMAAGVVAFIHSFFKKKKRLSIPSATPLSSPTANLNNKETAACPKPRTPFKPDSKPQQKKKQRRVASAATISRPTANVKKLNVVPTDRHAIFIPPRHVPLWKARNWMARKSDPNILDGVFRTKNNLTRGFIKIQGGDAESAPSFYVESPPPGIFKTKHAACFRKRGDNIYWVHFNTTGRNMTIDAGISAIERQFSDC